MDRVAFPGLELAAFQADTDRVALESLQKIPLLSKVIAKFYESGLDRWIYCYNMAMAVRCGPNQYATLHRILQDCCEILDVPEPELYLTSNPFPNAFAGGVERPYITLRSSIIDTLDDEQLYHLIGHELGHIKAGHVLYKTVALVLMPLLEMIGRRTFGVGDAAHIALVAAFMEWSRQAEITCDRAGLLCAQDIDLSLSANLHLCGGPNRLSHEASPEAFREQARSYQDMSKLDAVGKVLIWTFMSQQGTHPMPVHRTQHLERWVRSGQFDRLLKKGSPLGAPLNRSEAAG